MKANASVGLLAQDSFWFSDSAIFKSLTASASASSAGDWLPSCEGDGQTGGDDVRLADQGGQTGLERSDTFGGWKKKCGFSPLGKCPGYSPAAKRPPCLPTFTPAG